MCKGKRIPEKIWGKKKVGKITFVGLNACYSNQNTMVLTKRETRRPMEQYKVQK